MTTDQLIQLFQKYPGYKVGIRQETGFSLIERDKIIIYEEGLKWGYIAIEVDP